jgi:hypothetical protein
MNVDLRKWGVVLAAVVVAVLLSIFVLYEVGVGTIRAIFSNWR